MVLTSKHTNIFLGFFFCCCYVFWAFCLFTDVLVHNRLAKEKRKRLLTQFKKCCPGSDPYHVKVNLFMKITLFEPNIWNINGLAFNDIQGRSQDCSLTRLGLFNSSSVLRSLLSLAIVKTGIFHIKIMLF